MTHRVDETLLKRFEWQQRNPESVGQIQQMRDKICTALNVPKQKIKSGVLTPLIKAETGEITHINED